jgi:hypothetical protein
MFFLNKLYFIGGNKMNKISIADLEKNGIVGKIENYLKENEGKSFIEQGANETFIMRLKSILKKYNLAKETSEKEINVDVMEFDTFREFTGGLN